MKNIIFIFIVLAPVVMRAQDITKIQAVDAYHLINSRDIETSGLIDGRTLEMFNSGHIETAVNINAFSEDAPDQLKKYLSKKKLFIYCSNHTRSERLIEILKSLNYSGEIVFISDGINGWNTAGYKVVENNPDPINLVEKSINSVEKSKLKPIVQIFGTAMYDIENNLYDYHFGRAHLGFQYRFNESWNAKIIIDRGRATSVGDITVTDSSGIQMNVQNASKEGAYYTMFLKFASLQWKVNENLTLEGGAILQNHYISQERFWGFRYVAQTFQDLYWKIPSSDLGFIAYYKINPVFSFDVALTNGEGPRVIQDAFGKVKFAGGLNINPSENFQTRVYYHNKQTGTETFGTEQMVSVFAGYRLSKKLRVGGEFNYIDNLNNLSELKSYGFSLYSAYQIIENTQLFVRYDRLFYDTGSNTFTDIRGNGNALMGGLSYSPVDGVNLSLNYQGWIPDTNKYQSANNILFSMEYKF